MLLILSIITYLVASTDDILNDVNTSVLFESNNIIPAQNTLIGTVPIYNEMRLSLSIKINSFPTDVNGANVFQVGWVSGECCGGGNFQRYPALYISKNKCLEFRMTNNINLNNRYSYCDNITLNELYIINIIYTQSLWLIAINDTILLNDTSFGSHQLFNNINVYASVPQLFHAADVFIQHLLISKLQFAHNDIINCTINEFPSCKPYCVQFDAKQKVSAIYRINGTCYKAVSECNGCLETLFTDGIDNTNTLQNIPCDKCVPLPTNPTASPTNFPTHSPTNKCNINNIVQIESLQNVEFEEITVENFGNFSMQIGWIKILSCVEGNDPTTFVYYIDGEKQNYIQLVDNQEKYFEYINNLVSQAITVKFAPPGKKTNVHYDNLVVISKPCSNPIFSLNSGMELSFTVNITDGNIIGPVDLNNWIGTLTAKQRLVNDVSGFLLQKPRDIRQTVYHARNNAGGIHVSLSNSYASNIECWWDYSDTMHQNVEIYLGFHVDKNMYCDFTDGEGKLTFVKQNISQLSTANIIITNENNINLSSWIAFNISNVDLSCGGYIESVEISDHKNYKTKWLNYSEHLHGCGIYEFVANNGSFTLPILIRITRKYNDTINEIIVSNNITSLDAFKSFDFGINFCWEIPSTTLNQNQENDNVINQGYLILACILGVGCFVFAGCTVGMVIFYRKSHKSKNECICNALVAVIAIGEYDNDDMEISNADITDTYLRDLPVDVDLENIKELFARLNYKVMYKPISSVRLENESDCRWTEKEVVDFLSNDVGDELTNESANYDGLIVFVSCHGIDNSIVTSDYRIIETTVLHRLISMNHTSSRNIPRLFLFDCCNGSAKREYIRASTVKINYESLQEGNNISTIACESNEMTKAVVLKDIPNDSAWRYGTKNPDYKLAQVYAANPAFQAKCCTIKGSYLIYEFIQMLWTNTQNGSNQTLLTMFDKIQNTLHDSGKQQITTSFNNGTGYLQIVKNDIDRKFVQNNKEHTNKALNSQSEMQPFPSH
eukprot:366523_1